MILIMIIITTLSAECITMHSVGKHDIAHIASSVFASSPNELAFFWFLRAIAVKLST